MVLWSVEALYVTYKENQMNILNFINILITAGLMFILSEGHKTLQKVYVLIPVKIRKKNRP